MGQRTFIIGISPRLLALFRLRLRFYRRRRGGLFGFIACGGWIARTIRRALPSGRSGLGLVRLGRALVRIAAVVRLIEPRALEDDARTRAEQTPQLLLAALGAFLEVLVAHRLKFFEGVLAGIALVIIR